MSLLFFMIYRGLPIILALLTISRGYIYTIGEVNKLPESLVRQLNFKPYKLLVYPIVLILTFVPSLIDQIWNIFDENRSIWVVILRVAVTHSIGFINALMYILLRELYQVPNRKSEEEALLNFRRTSLFLNSDFWTNANCTSHLASPCSPDYRSPGIC